MSVDQLIGQTIAQRYRVIRKLGRDGRGSVYLAEELATGNPVAVKFFPEELDCDRESLKHCWSEARFATASIPSHVVRVHNVDRTDEGRGFIVMEYLEGESLAEVLRREGPLELDRALRLASQIARALASTSRAGLVHRDLKPENVMVLGPDESIKLTDFGVARLRETVAGGRRPGLGILPSEYTAPEELQGADVTVSADVFSLGAMLYTMLTGVAPDGRADGPAPVRALRPEVPVALEQLVMRAMAREPERRPSGIEFFVEGLRAAAAAAAGGSASHSIPDAPPEGAPRGAGWRPGRRTLALAGAAGLVVAGLVVWSLLDWRTGSRGTMPPPVVSSPATPDTRTAGGSTGTPAPPAETVRRPPEATPPVPPATPERQPGPVAQADDERRRQARVDATPRPDEGRRRPAETEAARRAGEERRRGEVEAPRLAEDYRRRQAEAEAAVRRAEEERRRQAEAETAARRAEEERRRQAEAEAARRAEDERRRQAEAEAARRAEEERRQRAEAEAAVRRAEDEQRQRAEAEAAAVRRAEDEQRQRAEAEAAAARRAEDEQRQRAEAEAAAARRAEDEQRQRAEAEAAARRAEEERRRQAEAAVAARRAEEDRRRQAEAEAARLAAAARRPASPPVQVARPAEPAPARPPTPALSAQELARIRAQAEQRLLGRGLLRVSPADRWGVVPDVDSGGVVTLSGVLRDMLLYQEAIQVVREIPGVQGVTATGVRLATGTVPALHSDSARLRAEIQQRLRSHGLLRESSADRWGVTVEVGAAGEVTLAGVVRDAGLRGEAVRLAQEVPGVRQVKQDIRVAEGAGRP